MSLSKRNSRIIVVDHEQYRWSPAKDSGALILIVQHATGTGRKLEVVISDSENVVIENGSYSIDVGNVNKELLTPRLVSSVIRNSLSMGWNPAKSGPHLRFSLKDLTTDPL